MKGAKWSLCKRKSYDDLQCSIFVRWIKYSSARHTFAHNDSQTMWRNLNVCVDRKSQKNVWVKCFQHFPDDNTIHANISQNNLCISSVFVYSALREESFESAFFSNFVKYIVRLFLTVELEHFYYMWVGIESPPSSAIDQDQTHSHSSILY